MWGWISLRVCVLFSVLVTCVSLYLTTSSLPPPPSSHPRIINALQTVSFTFHLTTSSNQPAISKKRRGMEPRLLEKLFFPLQENWILCPPGDKYLFFFPLALQHMSQISQNVLAASSALALRRRRASRRRDGSTLLLQRAVVRPLPPSWLPPLHPLAAHPPLLKCQRSSGEEKSVRPGRPTWSLPLLASCSGHHCCLGELRWS